MKLKQIPLQIYSTFLIDGLKWTNKVFEPELFVSDALEPSLDN